MARTMRSPRGNGGGGANSASHGMTVDLSIQVGEAALDIVEILEEVTELTGEDLHDLSGPLTEFKETFLA